MTARFTVRYRIDAGAARLATEWASQHSMGRPLSLRRATKQPSGHDDTRESVNVSRIWLDSPSRWRHELTSDDNRTTLVVVDVPRWWSLLPGGRAYSNADDPLLEPAVSEFPYDGLFQADELIASLNIHEQHVSNWQSREVIRLVASPGDELHVQLPRGADRYELLLDVEYQVVRRVVASTQGNAFAIIEVPELVFDEALPPELFVLDLPHGVVFQKPIAPQRHAAPMPPRIS